MPIYEYQCRSCSRRIEVIQRFGDPPLATCDECGGALSKLLSAPAFQFKGSGWYVTDYARKGGGNGNEGEMKPAADKVADAGKTDAGKTDAGKSDSGKSSGDSAAVSTKPAAGEGHTKAERIAAKKDG